MGSNMNQLTQEESQSLMELKISETSLDISWE